MKKSLVALVALLQSTVLDDDDDLFAHTHSKAVLKVSARFERQNHYMEEARDPLREKVRSTAVILLCAGNFYPAITDQLGIGPITLSV